MSTAESITEESLVRNVRSGDRNALKYIYKAYWPMVLQFVRLNSGTSEDAEELYQEGVIALYERLRDPAFTLTCSLRTYLYSVCRNKWLYRLRSKPALTDIEEYVEHLPEEVDEDMDLPNDVTLWNAITSLGESCKKLLIGYYYDKLSLEELAAQLNYSGANVAKQQKFRCMDRLKKILKLANS